MNKYDNVDNYLSIRRITLLSLAITLAFYLLFTISRYYGRPTFADDKERKELVAKRGKPVEAQAFEEKTSSCCSSQGRCEQGPCVDEREMRKCPTFGANLLLNIPLTFILVFSVFFYIRKIMSIKFRWQRDELIANIVGSMLIALVLSTLFTMLQMWIWPYLPGPPRTPFHRIRSGWFGDLPLMAFAIMSSYLSRSLYQRKMIAVENETLLAENMRTRYESLKNQMDPHFLFNSLNTLQSLIEIDKDNAKNYIQQLSTVLRYTLQNKAVVTLAEELDCVRSYCSMMKMRYGDNLRFERHIDHQKYDGYYVLPLSIQGLMENAIKHNVISSKQPLTVHIVTDENNHLIVSNRIQPKIENEKGSGIGLVNLAERYRLQWEENVEITDDGKVFSVILPLKENEKYESTDY